MKNLLIIGILILEMACLGSFVQWYLDNFFELSNDAAGMFPMLFIVFLVGIAATPYILESTLSDDRD